MPLPSEDKPDARDIYNLEFLRRYLEVPTLALTGTHIKVFAVMGDRVAVSLLKHIRPDLMLSELMLGKVLLALREAFASLDSVEYESDRVPAVTMCLLESLLARSQTPEKRKITSAIEEIRNACKPHN